MTRTIVFPLLICYLVLAGALQAQPGKSNGPESRLKILREALELTPEQTAGIDRILQNEARQMEQLREMNRQNPEALRAAAMDLRAGSERQIENMLNPAQREKFKQIKNRLPLPVVDPRALKLKKQLNLNDEQAAAVEQVLRTFRDQMQTLRDESGGDRRANAAKMRALMQERDRRIEALLNERQKEKYRELIKEQRQEFRNNMRRGGGRGRGTGQRPW